MQGKNRHGYIFNHAFDNARLDHTHQRDMGREHGQVELINSGSSRKNNFGAGKPRHHILGRLPHREVTHKRGITGFGPDMACKTWRLFRYQRFPFRTPYGISLVKESHQPSA